MPPSMPSGAAPNPAAAGPDPRSAPLISEVLDSMQGFQRATHWSTPYYSSLIHNNPQLPAHLFEHVNCSYFSTPGRPPTLLALKQHAQSLASMIQLIAPSQLSAGINAANGGGEGGTTTPHHDALFAENQAFDWLNNLGAHYHTEERAHHLPLNSLVNLVRDNSDTHGPRWHCPLERLDIQYPEDNQLARRPFESHMTLLMHANELLERLDHEYSALGGLLAILPLNDDDAPEHQEMERAKKTLVGQWLLYTQALVGRMHELEIALGNCQDLLANEAVVPMQRLSLHGADGRGGREIVFPQDRWIMANAGEDVAGLIHRKLNQLEAYEKNCDRVYDARGVVGSSIGEEDPHSGQKKYKGIVYVDVSTRFYRLRESGEGPLFVIPAFGERDDVKHTRDIEKRPTVISVPEPKFPSRLSEWEAKNKEAVDKYNEAIIKSSNLEYELNALNGTNQLLKMEIDNLRQTHAVFEQRMNQGDVANDEELARLRFRVQSLEKAIQDGKEASAAVEQELAAFRLANKLDADESYAVMSEKREPGFGNTFLLESAKPKMKRTQTVQEFQQLHEELRALRVTLSRERKAFKKDMENVSLENMALRFPDVGKKEGWAVWFNKTKTDLLEARRQNEFDQDDLAELRVKLVSTEQKLREVELHSDTLASTAMGADPIKAKQLETRIIDLEQRLKDSEAKVKEEAGISPVDVSGYEARIQDLEQRLMRSEGSRDQLQQQIDQQGPGHAPAAPLLNFPPGFKFAFGNSFRDKKKEMVVTSTQRFDHLEAAEKERDSLRAERDAARSEAAALRQQLEAPHSKPPSSPEFKGSFLRDDNKNVVMCSTQYFDGLAAEREQLAAARDAAQAEAAGLRTSAAAAAAAPAGAPAAFWPADWDFSEDYAVFIDEKLGLAVCSADHYNTLLVDLQLAEDEVEMIDRQLTDASTQLKGGGGNKAPALNFPLGFRFDGGASVRDEQRDLIAMSASYFDGLVGQADGLKQQLAAAQAANASAAANSPT
ncbi:hypothetical protein GGR56DRAFT_681454 [Xylariaceae sp. FL0804]|nr:hypothetical protein GGR56DRAFT_681454 [Xylariaceae sp. FL0804]